MHGARDPEDLRGFVGEFIPPYIVSGASVIDLPLNTEEMEFVAARVRLGRAPSATDLLLRGLRSMIDPAAEDLRAYGAWRDSVRCAIDEAYEESARDDVVDGVEFREELRLEIDAQEIEPK